MNLRYTIEYKLKKRTGKPSRYVLIGVWVQGPSPGIDPLIVPPCTRG